MITTDLDCDSAVWINNQTKKYAKKRERVFTETEFFTEYKLCMKSPNVFFPKKFSYHIHWCCITFYHWHECEICSVLFSDFILDTFRTDVYRCLQPFLHISTCVGAGNLRPGREHWILGQVPKALHARPDVFPVQQKGILQERSSGLRHKLCFIFHSTG